MNKSAWFLTIEMNETHLAAASLTRILGLAKSSRRRWLCSSSRRYRSSDIDCLPPRELMFMVLVYGEVPD
jgi:hypothetical protein